MLLNTGAEMTNGTGIMKKALKYLAICIGAALLVANTPVFTDFSTALAGCNDTAEPGVQWQDCRKRNLIVADYDFTGANFTRADLTSSDLRGTNLTESQFVKANLVRASLKGSRAVNANFSGVTASRTDFSESNLTDTDFSKSEIIRSDFSGSRMENADLTKSDFFRSSFREANLNLVDFSFSSLARVDFRDAQLGSDNSFTSAFFYRTLIEGVDLSAVKGLVQWQIDMACGDDATVLPEGLQKPDSWPCNSEENE